MQHSITSRFLAASASDWPRTSRSRALEVYVEPGAHSSQSSCGGAIRRRPQRCWSTGPPPRLHSHSDPDPGTAYSGDGENIICVRLAPDAL